VNWTGTGSPAVIVENGGGSFPVEWVLVQPEVAKHTRICTYDRAGYAWSDRGPTVDSIEEIVDDLNLLLRKAHIRPPYIFVGASLGAIFARSFERRFPEQVSGMVFVDGSADEGVTLMKDGKPTPISLLPAEELPAAYEEYMRVAPKPKAGPADAHPLDRLPPDLQKTRQWVRKAAR
jgi:pimeloyl-ACP methyl ester carboxylesterase